MSEFRDPEIQQRYLFYSTLTVPTERLWLSYPHDVGPNGLSILSPAGTALLGLRAGQSMKWTDRDGKIHEVRVVAVNNRRGRLRFGIGPTAGVAKVQQG